MSDPPLPPPGVDPVADHGWCCTHSEQWRYFAPDAEARMLSALGRIFRVDPVETEFLLDLAEWAATEAALPVAERLVQSGDLAPKLARRAAALRETLLPAAGEAPADAPPPADPAQAPTQALPTHALPTHTLPTHTLPTHTLIDRLHQTADRAARERIAAVLASRADAKGEDRFAIACELLGERHPAGAASLAKLLSGVERTALTDEQRAIAALAAAASGLDSAVAPLIALIGSGTMDAHDLYEAVKAIASDPPAALDAPARAALLSAVHRALRPRTRTDRARALVIDAMLLGTGAHRRVSMAAVLSRVQPLTRGERAFTRRALAEASGFIDAPSSLRRLYRYVLSTDRSVRSEATRALRRLGTAQAARVALRGLRAVVATRAPVDIDSAEAIHTTVDLLVQTGAREACDTLARILRHDAFDGHGVQGRTAIALAQLDDPRCLLRHGPSGLPHLVLALLSPLPVTPGRARTQRLFDEGVAWLERHTGLPLAARDAPNEHLHRVHTSRRILAWSDASQGRTADTERSRTR